MWRRIAGAMFQKSHFHASDVQWLSPRSLNLRSTFGFIALVRIMSATCAVGRSFGTATWFVTTTVYTGIECRRQALMRRSMQSWHKQLRSVHQSNRTTRLIITCSLEIWGSIRLQFNFLIPSFFFHLQSLRIKSRTIRGSSTGSNNSKDSHTAFNYTPSADRAGQQGTFTGSRSSPDANRHP